VVSTIAGKIKGITIEIGGDTQKLNKALEDVNKKTRDVQSELRQVERLLKLDPGNTDLLAQKQKLLAEAVENSREKLDRLRAAQQQVNEQFRKGEINEEQYRAFQREVVKAEQELAKFEKQLRETGLTAEQVGQKLKDAGQKMTDVGKNLSMKVTAPIVAAGAAATKLGMDFEAAMSEVGAISGATGEDLKKLEALAKEMGATTKFSASEAAEGLKYMAMAGWDTQQQLDGLPGVLNLAAASGESLGAVSDIVTDAMTAFGMEAAQAGEFADTLAAASSNANTNVGMLGESFKYVAPVAGALGFEAKDTATALGLMANAGIKSSQAGTALRTMLTNLAKPTKEMQKAMDKYGISLTNTDGSMKSLNEVMLNLRESLGGLTEAEQAAAAATIFGKEAMSGALAIVNASEEDFNKLSHAINNSAGAAQKMADEMQDNLKGRLTELKSAIEGVALQLYDHLQPALEKIVEVVQKLVAWFANLSPGVQQTIIIIAGLAAAIGPLLVVLGAMASGLSAIIGILPVLGTALTAITGPVGIAVAAIAGVTAAGVALYKHLSQESIPAIELFGDEVSESTKQAVGSFMELNDQATLALNQLSWSGQEVTKEMADNIAGNFSQMASQVQAGLDKHHEQSLAKIQNFVTSSTALSKAEQDEILNNMQQGYENRKLAVAESEARIKKILDTASTEKRALTRAEQEEINAIQRQMVDTGIQVLSENEIEAKAIMERMKAQAGEISAQQAAEVVKNSIEQRDGAIKAANEQYDQVVKEIIRQRDEAGTITAEQADKLIQEATRQRDEAISKATEMHQRVVDEAKAQAQEHVNQVDWETGEVLNNWQVFKKDVGKTWDDIKEKGAETWDNMGTKISEAWGNIKKTTEETWESVGNIIKGVWNGIVSAVEGGINFVIRGINAFIDATNKVIRTLNKVPGVNLPTVGKISEINLPRLARGGIVTKEMLALVGEKGPEAVVPIDRLENMLAKIMQEQKGRGDIHQIVNVHSPVPLTPYETARQIKNASRQLAMEW